ncbi:MAG: hypothetical protein ACMUJM_14965 [bacterium]
MVEKKLGICYLINIAIKYTISCIMKTFLKVIVTCILILVMIVGSMVYAGGIYCLKWNMVTNIKGVIMVVFGLFMIFWGWFLMEKLPVPKDSPEKALTRQIGGVLIAFLGYSLFIIAMIKVSFLYAVLGGMLVLIGTSITGIGGKNLLHLFSAQ